MRFWLLLLLTGLLFLRPAELFPGVPEGPYYQIVMIACLVLGAESILSQFTPAGLATRPITACLLGLSLAIPLSHVAHGFLWGARQSLMAYGRVFAVYLVVVGTLDSFASLERYLKFLTACIVAIAGLALLHGEGVISLPSLAHFEQGIGRDSDTGEAIVLSRLRATGIFNDPNDFAIILVVGIVASFHWIQGCRQHPSRLAWSLPLVALLTALYETHSRGGLLALLFAAAGYVYVRMGWRRTVFVLVPTCAALLVLFSGRMTDADALTEGTGQSRVQLWSAALAHFKANPLFGMGHKQFVEQEYHVAHNSFIEAFAELGILGGGLFIGAFLAAFLSLKRLGESHFHESSDVLPLDACLMGILMGYGGGILTLSRAYVEPTYIVLAVAAAYARIEERAEGWPVLTLNRRFVTSIATASVVLVLATYVFVRFTARWSGGP
jgi:hypothetical protein